ncbi:MAG: tetratricopeptide repeat protein [Planctomycetota bacterium]
MARIVSTVALITLLSVLAGCQETGPDSARLMEIDTRRPINRAVPAGTSEADLVEEMVVNRDAYKSSLELMIAYYNRTGNALKLERARTELQAFQLMTKYRYIDEVKLLAGELEATTPIPAADDLYYDGVEFEKKAGPIRGLRDKAKLRLALQKYQQLIKNYSNSDKVDDATYKAGEILEEFKDYVVALDYYQSAYKADPETIYPARFRAARILDQQMHRYAEALALYKQAVAMDRFDSHRKWKEYSEGRIRDIEKDGGAS